MNFKYNIGDLTVYRNKNIFTWPRIRTRVITPARSLPSNRFVMNNTLGLILKKYSETDLFVFDDKKTHEYKFRFDFNGYAWYSINDSKVYLMYEFELEEVNK